MNFVYRSVWCEKTGTYVAASELAKGRTKSARSMSGLLVAALLGTSGALGAQSAFAEVIVNCDLDGETCTPDPTQPSQTPRLLGSGLQAVVGSKYFYVNSALADASALGTDSIAVGPVAVARGPNAVAIGNGAISSRGTATDGAIAIGNNAQSANIGDGTIAIGKNALVQDNGGTPSITAEGSIAIGYGSKTFGTQSITLGQNASTVNSYSVAIGGSSSTVGANTVALGAGASASTSSSSALGAGAKASTRNSVALGANSTTTADLTAAGYNAGSGTLAGTASTTNGEVSIGSASNERRLTNLAAGSAATDAVNVSQLQSEDAKVNLAGANIASALGGGSTYTPSTGAVSAPSYLLANANSIAGTTGAAADVGTGFGKVDAALGVLNTAVTQNTNLATATNRYFKAGGLNDGTDDASAGGKGVAIGAGAVSDPYESAQDSGAVAIGARAYATSAVSFNNAIKNPDGSHISDSVAIGPDASSAGSGALAVGVGAKANFTNIAIGEYANTDGDARNTMAIGQGASSTGWSSSAIGLKATTSGGASVALGQSANATADYSVALGSFSTTTADLTRPAFNPGSLTLQGIASTSNGEVSIGSASKERRLTNLAAGSAATDAVNVSQLQSEDAKVNLAGANTASALGGGSTYTSSTGAISAPSYLLTNANSIAGTTGAAADVGTGFGKVDAALGVLNTNVASNTTAITNITNGGGIKYFHANSTLADSRATGANALAIGPAAVAQGQNNIAIGNGAQSSIAGTADGNIAIGSGAVNNNTGDGAIVIGRNAVISDIGGNSGVLGAGSIAMGDGTFVYGNGGIAMGQGARSTHSYNIALGQGAQSTGGSGSLALGAEAAASTANSVALGSGSTTTANLGAAGYNPGSRVLSGTAPGSEVSIGSSGAERRLTNLAAGSAATDAVNVSQLQSEDAKVNLAGANIASALGGGSTYTPSTGAVSAPSYLLTNANGIAGTTGAAADVGTGFGKVDAALGVLNTNVTQNTADIAGNTSSISNINTSITNMGDTLADAVMYDSAAHDKVTLGNAGTPVQVTNVKAGELSAQSSDAVNGSQLFATNQQVAQNTGDISNITTNINSGSIGLVQQAGAGANLTVGKDTDGAAVDFAGTAGARKLINVADGTVAAGSKDAVNGSQLFATNQQVAQNTTDIAGNTTSISNLDGRVTNVEGDVSTLNTSITNMGDTLADAVMYDSAAHDKVTLGNAGTPVQVTNVKAGELSAQSSDAVNGSQLYATNQQVAQNTGDISNLDGRVTNVEGDVSTITTNINNGSIGLVQQAGAGANLTVGKDTDGAAVDFAGTAGARKLINVADGTVATGSKDAVNGGQLFGVSQSVADAIGGGSVVNPDGSISGPSYSVTNLDGSTSTVNNVGDAITNLDGRTTQNTTDINTLNTSITNMAGVMGDAVMYDSAAHDKVTLGNAGTPVQVTNVKAGELSAQSSDAVNGSQLYATNQQVAQNTGDISNLDGRVTNVEGDVSNITTNINNGSIGLVQQAGAGANLTVGKDTDGAAVDFAGTAGARKLINVADGTVATGSKDAVNGGQLFGVSQSVADAIGGGSVVNPDGSISGPSYSVTNLDGSTSTVNNVGDAITNLDGRTTQNTTDINTINTTINNMGDTLADAVMYDSAAHDKVTFGNAGTPVQLTNVKAGELSAQSSDAVNGSQLFATNQQVAQNTTNISSLDARVTNNEGDITNLDGRVTNVEGDISNITTNINNGSIGLVQQAGAGANLTVGKDTDGAAVDFAGTAGARKLINVADGTVAAGSKDAVNGGQLFGVSQSVADAIGGGSVVNPDGSISGPSYSVTNLDGSTSTVNNIGDAITNLDGRTTQNTTDINTINTTINNMAGVMGDAVMYDSAAHDKVTFGNAGTPVQLTNVKAGELSAQSSDAVNGSQLFATNQQVAQNTTDITNLDGRVTNIEGSVTNIVNGGGIKYFHTSSNKVDSVASGADSIAVGGGAVASGAGALAMGDNAQAAGKGNVVLGQNASDTTADGQGTRGAEAPYVGKYSGANNDNVVGTVSVGNAATGETRTISNVADGVQANDAVNVRQLDGAVAQANSYTDSKVQDAVGQVDNSVTEIKSRVTNSETNITNLQNGTDGMIQVNNTSNLPKPKATGTDSMAAGAGAESSGANSVAMGTNAKAKGKNSVAIGANSAAERDNSVAVGSAGNERQITSVAAGTERTDAVNLGQVSDALSDFASQSDSRYNALRKDLHEQDDRLSAGIAGAIAIASLPQPMVNGGSTTSVGIGNFNGQSAVSVGVSHTTNDGKWTAKIGGSVDTQNSFSIGAGVGYNW